jgi:hypothetical protein
MLQEITELEQRSAVQQQLILILRSRYLPRDSSPDPAARIPCNGAPVNLEIIEDVVEEMEEGIEEMRRAVNAYKAEEVPSV